MDAKDLQPIISALRYNKYFDGLTEKNFKMVGVVSISCDLQGFYAGK